MIYPMNIEKVKRYSLTEIVLLIIFVFGLLIAQLIVRVRSQIKLSDPVPLDGAGIAVSMPANSGPDRDYSWRYEKSDNCMTLVGRFGRQDSNVEVQWRYTFYTPDESPDRMLKNRAEKANAVLQKTGILQQTAPVTYGIYRGVPGAENGFYCGVVKLDLGRSLELLVVPRSGDQTYAENIFKTLAGSVQYQMPQELVDGGIILDSFLLARTTDQPEQPKAQEAFLITDELGRNLGFYYVRQSMHTDNGQTLYQMQIRQFEYQGLRAESNLWFTPAQQTFRWKSALRYPRMTAPSVYEIKSDEKGNLQVDSNIEKSRNLHTSRLILPKPLLGEYARTLLQSDYTRVIVDAMTESGQGIPVRVGKIALDSAHARSEDTTSVIRLDFLSQPDTFEELFFNSQRQLIGKYEQPLRQRKRLWDSVPLEQLQLIFKEDFEPPSEPMARMQ
jgi:hypothetical protein